MSVATIIGYIFRDCGVQPSDLWTGLFYFRAYMFVLISVGAIECKTLSI
jgi:hypothetical protein